MKALLPVLVTALTATACALPPPYSPPSRPAPAPPPAQPAPGEGPAAPVPQSEAGPAPAPPTAPRSEQPATRERTYTLSPATQALVTQARSQAAGGNYGVAAGTIERALRIEPDNPLLWIELGRVRLAEGNAPQAESLGRKAVSLASGDERAEATAWQLVADSLHERGRTAEAIEAEARARGLRTR